MIYLDHAAATPVKPGVLEAMKPYFDVDFFNPSAAYLPAKKVANDYENAKAAIAQSIGAKGSDLVMTAGATEANNLAFTAIAQDKGQKDHMDKGNEKEIEAENENEKEAEKEKGDGCSVLYLETEHDSVRKVAESYGGDKVQVLANGLVDLTDLKEKITDGTELISIALANNELGVVQPLAEVAQIIRETKIERMKRGIKRQLLLHSDASQAASLIDINVARLGVDLLTLNAGKVYGPKGVGALYVAHGVRLTPLTAGGGQERGLRSGTENVPGVIGFAAAMTLAKKHLVSNRKKYTKWRNILLDELEDYELINKKHCLDNFIVLCYAGLDAERLVYMLEEQKVYVATGAACAASKGVRSHVLKAIGLSDEQIAGSLRLTLGETNTEEQMHEAARIINEVVAKERTRVNQQQ